MRRFAQAQGYADRRRTYSDWIPQGAKHEPTTYVELSEFLLPHERAVICLDEIDKLTPALNDGWTTCIRNEIFGLLDRVWFDGRSPSATPAGRLVRRRLKDGVFFAACGTWQDLWEERRARSTVGFARCTSPLAQDIRDSLRRNGVISLELLNRFNGSHVVLEPLSRQDFSRFIEAEQLAAKAKAAGISIDLNEAVSSGLGMRWLENLVSEIHCRTPREPSSGEPGGMRLRPPLVTPGSAGVLAGPGIPARAD